eukprot:5823911-Pyramimonas_sp.AAC.1
MPHYAAAMRARKHPEQRNTFTRACPRASRHGIGLSRTHPWAHSGVHRVVSGSLPEEAEAACFTYGKDPSQRSHTK